MVLIRVGESYRGLACIGNRKYCFYLLEDKLSGQLSSLEVDWRLKKLLDSSLNDYLSENQFSDIREFHEKFIEFIQTQVSEAQPNEEWLKNPLDACALVKSLQEDLKNVGEHIKHIDVEKRIVGIEINDIQFRIHKALLKLSQEYPRGFIEIVQLDLPNVKTVFNENMFDMTQISTVTEFTKKFIKVVNVFQEFWNIMATIDLQCVVLDPVHPTFRDIFRRIKLHENLSVGLTIDPIRPRQIPFIKLFGPFSDIDVFREKLQRNLEKEVWDCNEDLMYNISNLLDVAVPNKMFAEDDLFKLVQEEECAICFLQRLNDDLPNEMCETHTCHLKYHSVCLFRYLSSFPKNKAYFGKMQGECPGCDNIITCTVPKCI